MLIIMIIADVITAGIAWLAFPFFYNKKYIEDLIEKDTSLQQERMQTFSHPLEFILDEES